MSKIRVTPNLLIVGTVLSLIAVNALANNISVPTNLDSYSAETPLMQEAPSQTLGTLRQNEINAPAAAVSNSNQSSTQSDTSAELQPMQFGRITYITGGIGDEERTQLQSIKNEYNLHVISASKDGSFNGETRIIILTQAGTELLNVLSGPLFFAKLPAGSYSIKASDNGQTKQQRITINLGKSSHVHFSW